MNKILITGGTGFVGYWMRQTEPKELNTFYLSRVKYLLENWDIHNWDYIVHLAPVSPASVLKSAKNSGARLLYCSSGAAYDQPTEYADNKRRWEAECLASGVEVVIARLFTFYGERLDEYKAISQFQKAANEGKPIYIHGNGKTVRSYMHGSEMGKWLWAILFKGKSGQIYDVGSDEPITILELAKLFSDNIIVAGGKDPMPYYMPHNTAKTRALLKERTKWKNQRQIKN